MYQLLRMNLFDETFNQLEKFEQKRVLKFQEQLRFFPFAGKPLGFKFFREKKFNGKRMLYIIYEELNVIFFVNICDKKSQQKEIDIIKANFESYKEIVSALINMD